MSLIDKIQGRTVRAVDLKSLPGVEVYVATLTASEFIAIGERALKAGNDRNAKKALEAELLLRDKDGNRLLADGEGAAFVERIYAVDMDRITKVGQELNDFSDAALEQTEKN